METMDIPGNAIKNEPKNPGVTNYEKPVKTIKAKGTKATIKGKFLSYWLPEDVHDLRTYWSSQKEYVMRSIIVPNLKKIIVEAINGMLNTNFSVSNFTARSRSMDRVSYDSAYNSNISRKTSGPTNQKPKTCFYEDLIFDTKDDANFHKDLITDEFNRNNGSLSVLKFMELAGQETSHTQADWGWLTLNGYKCEYSTAEDGWIVSMPWPRDEVRQ